MHCETKVDGWANSSTAGLQQQNLDQSQGPQPGAEVGDSAAVPSQEVRGTMNSMQLGATGAMQSTPQRPPEAEDAGLCTPPPGETCTLGSRQLQDLEVMQGTPTVGAAPVANPESLTRRIGAAVGAALRTISTPARLLASVGRRSSPPVQEDPGQERERRGTSVGRALRFSDDNGGAAIPRQAVSWPAQLGPLGSILRCITPATRISPTRPPPEPPPAPSVPPLVQPVQQMATGLAAQQTTAATARTSDAGATPERRGWNAADGYLGNLRRLIGLPVRAGSSSNQGHQQDQPAAPGLPHPPAQQPAPAQAPQQPGHQQQHPLPLQPPAPVQPQINLPPQPTIRSVNKLGRRWALSDYQDVRHRYLKNTETGRHRIGDMVYACPHCHALHWLDERTGSSAANPQYQMCCAKGKVHLPELQEPPSYIKTLLTSQGPASRKFRREARKWNSIFQLASTGLRSPRSMLCGIHA